MRRLRLYNDMALLGQSWHWDHRHRIPRQLTCQRRSGEGGPRAEVAEVPIGRGQAPRPAGTDSCGSAHRTVRDGDVDHARARRKGAYMQWDQYLQFVSVPPESNCGFPCQEPPKANKGKSACQIKNSALLGISMHYMYRMGERDPPLDRRRLAAGQIDAAQDGSSSGIVMPGARRGLAHFRMSVRVLEPGPVAAGGDFTLPGHRRVLVALGGTRSTSAREPHRLTAAVLGGRDARGGGRPRASLMRKAMRAPRHV